MSTDSVATMSSQRDDLVRYAPLHLRIWPDGENWITVAGTLCFADISGFTALSERLAERGRIGAEELTSILDDVFGRMLQTAERRGGTLLKYGGDALLLFFEGPDHATQAASAAVEMRSVLAGVKGTPTSAGRLALRMSQGIHSGDVTMIRAVGSHEELIVLGPSVTEVMAMEHAASPSEILVSGDTRRLLGEDATSDRVGPGWPLRWRKPRAALPKRVSRPAARVTNRFVPLGLRELLDSARPDAEHRLASVIFVKVSGTDQLLANAGPEVLAEEVGRIVTGVLEQADNEDVTFLASDADADGFKLILAAGVPRSQDDEEGRALRVASHIAEVTSVLVVKVGVNRGHVFVGEVGTIDRATYTIIGDTVNTSARMMAAAPACVVYTGVDVVERSRTLFEVSTPEPIRVKGKAEPLRVVALGMELGDRGDETDRGGEFVGRQTELDRLADAMQRAESGSGSWYSIIGPTGIGKTRLTDEAVSTTTATLLEARAEPYGAANPYRPFRDPIRHILGISLGTQSEMASALQSVVASHVPHLQAFVPLLGDVAHIEIPATPETDRIARKFRQSKTADILIELLDAILEGPAVFTFDDAHWADPATAAMLDSLAAASATRSWFGIETAREGSSDLRETIELEGLTKKEMTKLLESRTEASPLRPDVVASLVDRAGGSPLFAEELVTALRSTGDIDDLPTSLEGVVATQIDALNPLARRVLRYVSVLGRSFRNSVARDLIATQGIELNAATRTALGEFLDTEGSDRLIFRHAMVRDVAYAALSFNLRKELHHQAAELILGQGRGDDEGIADILAFHFYHSGDAAPAWRYSLIAGDRYMARYANPEAAVQFGRALEVARDVPDVTDDDLRDVYVKLGDVLELSGAFEASIDAYRSAAKLTGGDRFLEADVRLKMARARERAGKYSSAIADTTRARRLVGDDLAVKSVRRRAEALGYAALIRQAQQKPRKALHIAAEAAELASQVGDEFTLARAWVVLDWAYFMTGRSREAVYGLDALEIYERLNDLNKAAAVAINLGGFAFEEGDWDKAVRFYEKARDDADEAGNTIHAAHAAANIGEIFVYQGRVEMAVEALTAARRVYQASGFTEGIVFVDLLLARAHALRGDLADARQVTESALAAATDLGLDGWRFEASIHLAEIDALCGAPEAALIDLTAARDSAPDVYRDHYQLVYARTEAMVRAASGEVEAAIALVDEAITQATDRGDDFERTLLVLTRRHIAQDSVTSEEFASAKEVMAGLGVVRAPLPVLAHS